jgi:galactosamine-6-phosphate isomerase
MKERIFEDYDTLCGEVAGEICRALQVNPSLLLCIAAGHTSLGLFKRLIRAEEEGRIDFSSSAFVAMDEWLGMDEDTPGSCGELLRKKFLNHVNLKSDQICLFNGAASDPGIECRRVEEFIIHHSRAIDYLVLGAGMNGHLALNEPGTPFSSRAHVSKLDSVTRQIGRKYFNGPVKLTTGLTLGIGNFLEARRAVLMVSGAHKKDILQRILHEPVSPLLPATAIRTIADSALYYDKAAGG